MPSVEYFVHWYVYRHLWLEAHEHFQKHTWRNRTAIQSPGEPILLSVPLEKGKHQQKPIREVKIAYHEPWPKLHLQSFQSVYGKTAFGMEVLPAITEILMAEPATLWELNEQLLVYVVSLLGGAWGYEVTGEYLRAYPEDINDIRQGIAGGASSHSAEKIPTYPQVHRLSLPFQPNLSILDVLCHLGSDSSAYIARYAAALYPKP